MESFLKQAGITYHMPGMHAEFDSIQSSYTGLHRAAQPAIITLPESEAHVAAIVKHCIAVDLDFVIRGGGHDCHGRYTVKDALSIDLRKLNSVTIAPDRKTASVGGGTTLSRFLEILDEQQLHGPSGICGDVGYVGWCLIGGVGPWSTCYGIGSDQIVGAKVVNSCGELVQADEMLLKGLRGGGGCLAIVVELKVKVYPIKEVSWPPESV
jgi:FAD/FMN-containing dehydrogenase